MTTREIAPAIQKLWAPHMHTALKLAKQAAINGDVPVGAVVINEDGLVTGLGYNRREIDGDPSAHAEIMALRQAAQTRGSWNLTGHSLVVTLEPCTMCAGAIELARITRLIFGAWEPKTGAVGSVRDIIRDPANTGATSSIEVIAGLETAECQQLITQFFQDKRDPTTQPPHPPRQPKISRQIER